MSNKNFRIVFNGSEFILLDGEHEVGRHYHPGVLSKQAFNEGADIVRHDYDLAIAENLHWPTPFRS